MSIEKTIFVYCDSSGSNYFLYKAATGNINLDAAAGTEEDIKFSLVVDSSAAVSPTGETVSWGWAGDEPTSGNDLVSGYGFNAARSPDNQSNTPVSEVFGTPSITANQKYLQIPDNNPTGATDNSNLYGFTVTVIGTYTNAAGTTQTITVTTDPTIRNRN